MRALVIGSAPSVTDHLEEAGRLDLLNHFWTVFVVNDVGVWYPGPIAHWCSIHGAYFKSKSWLAGRATAGYNDDFTAWGAFEPRSGGQAWFDPGDVDLRHIPTTVSIKGSSGLVACLLALEMGAEKVALAGITMDESKDVLGPGRETVKASHKYSVYRTGWEDHAELLRDGRVASFGGWTQDHIQQGVDREWIRA